jgi:hypothetical protein
MATITPRFGSGGANVVPGGAEGFPTLAQVLRDIADDLASVQAPTIASPDAVDLPSALTLLNEIKAKLNAIHTTALKTVKG